MKLEFLVRDKDMVKMLMLNEVEYFYNSHLFNLLKKEALMDGDNKISNMFYKYVSNAKDIVNGSIVEKIDGSLSKIYLGLNDNGQRHGFKIEPCELSLKEKRNVILKYVYKKSNKKLLTDGVNNIVVMHIHYDGENYISEERWFEVLQYVVKGYNSVMKLSEAEKESIPVVMKNIELLFVAYFIGEEDEVAARESAKLFYFVKDNQEKIKKNLTFA